MEALKLLGRKMARSYVAKNLDEALKRLRAERDENECRKDFSPSEAVREVSRPSWEKKIKEFQQAPG